MEEVWDVVFLECEFDSLGEDECEDDSYEDGFYE